MSQQHLTAKDLIEKVDVSGLDFYAFLIPYGFVTKAFSMAIGFSAAMCKKSALAEGIVKVITVLLFIAPIYIFCNIIFRFTCFWGASIYRLFFMTRINVKNWDKNDWNKILKNIWFVFIYTFIFATVYMTWVIPHIFGYVDWETVMVWLQIA